MQILGEVANEKKEENTQRSVLPGEGPLAQHTYTCFWTEREMKVVLILQNLKSTSFYIFATTCN